MDTTVSFLPSLLIFAAIAAGFRALTRTMLDATRLPAACYQRPSYSLAALADWSKTLVLVGLVLPLAAASAGLVRLGFVSGLFGWWGPDWIVGAKGGLGWATFGDGSLLRILLTVTAAVPAWAYSAHARNHFFDRAHLADRLLLAASVAGVWLHPVMVLPSLVMTLWSIHQLTHPRFVNYAWTQVRVPLDLMVAFVVCLYARVLFGVGTGMMLAVLLTVLGASYFIPGVCKIGVGPYPCSWLVRNRSSQLLVSACNYGFWGRTPERVYLRAAAALRVLDLPMALVTLAVELGAILLLADHRAAMWILAGCILLHVGIALASGIMFWKWAIPVAAMIWVLAHLGVPTLNHVFTVEHLALSVIACGASPWWLKPVELGWEDTGLNSYFRMEAVGPSGAVYEVGRTFMAPYDIYFCQSRLFFLIDRPILLGTLGCQTRRQAEFRDLATAINQSGGEDSALAPLRARYGRAGLDDGLATSLDLFLTRFFVCVNAGRPSRVLPLVPPAPPHFAFGTRLTPYRRQEPVALLRIRFLESFCTGSDIRTLVDKVVREVRIPGQDAAATGPDVAATLPARRIARARAG